MGVNERGTRIQLTLSHPSDLNRDILKVTSTIKLYSVPNYNYSFVTKSKDTASISGDETLAF